MFAQDHTLFFSARGRIDAAGFAAGVAEMRARIRGHSHVCNLFQDRLHFALGIAAALQNGQPTVLPPSDAPEAIAASLAGAVRPLVLGKSGARDDPAMSGAAPPPDDSAIAALFRELAQASAEIGVFTSGTTKQPERVVKTWPMLRAGASVTDLILNQLDAEPGQIALLGTTPARHMFGLEATIFATLGFGRCTWRDTIFYPADLETALAAARSLGLSRLVLVTSPAHLRFLEPVILNAPEICCVLSATAPLATAAAERLESRGDLRVMEIYGSTETGSLAYRRTAQDTAWTPAAGFTLTQGTDACIARAPHLVAPVPLGDEVELQPDARFALLGRTGDMVNIRGKRNRISALNAVLAECPCIADGAFLHVRHHDSDRLAIVAVPADPSQSADVTRRRLRDHLLQYFEPAFVPKTILLRAAIVRTPTGKIAQETLRDLIAQAGLVDRRPG